MILSIVTINFNNKVGLNLTLASVIEQTYKDFEHLIIDGGSTDGSVAVIADYVKQVNGGYSVRWVSESDGGIYNAMNKGIGMAQGEYLQFLNSGDVLVSNDVVEQMGQKLEAYQHPPIMVGNMIKVFPNGKRLVDWAPKNDPVTMLTFYQGTLNHSSAYIKRSLFEQYGVYDESLKIVSDWKWYLQVVGLHGVEVQMVDVDVTLFDMSGVSETNRTLLNQERNEVLESLLPASILTDYKQWAFSIEQMKRLKRHVWAYQLVWFLERVLFKTERSSFFRKKYRK